MYDENREQQSDARLVLVVAYFSLAASLFNLAAFYWLWKIVNR